jgi:hypothetical protein
MRAIDTKIKQMDILYTKIVTLGLFFIFQVSADIE